MQKLHYLLLLVLIMFSTPLSAQDDPFKSVQNLFAAIADCDHDEIASLVTGDFHLLEVGEVWDTKDLIEAIGSKKSGRRNFFHPIRTVIDGDMAWVSYWNKATFPDSTKRGTVAWLESAVLVKDENAWRVQMLHSTRIEPQALPANIELTEYKN
jgi:hypothetical protein